MVSNIYKKSKEMMKMIVSIYFFGGIIVGVILCWAVLSYARKKQDRAIEEVLNEILHGNYYFKIADNDKKVNAWI